MPAIPNILNRFVVVIIVIIVVVITVVVVIMKTQLLHAEPTISPNPLGTTTIFVVETRSDYFRHQQQRTCVTITITTNTIIIII